MQSKYVTLEQAKANQRIDDDDSDDLIMLYLCAAEDHVVAYLNCPLYVDDAEQKAAVDKGETDGIVIKNDIKAAILMTFGFFYENREDVGHNNTAAAIPVNAHRLLDQHRKRPGV